MQLERVLCSGRRFGRPCGRRLLDLTPDALRDGARLEVKCSACNHVTILSGPAAADASAA